MCVPCLWDWRAGVNFGAGVPFGMRASLEIRIWRAGVPLHRVWVLTGPIFLVLFFHVHDNKGINTYIHWNSLDFNHVHDSKDTNTYIRTIWLALKLTYDGIVRISL